MNCTYDKITDLSILSRVGKLAKLAAYEIHIFPTVSYGILKNVRRKYSCLPPIKPSEMSEDPFPKQTSKKELLCDSVTVEVEVVLKE